MIRVEIEIEDSCRCVCKSQEAIGPGAGRAAAGKVGSKISNGVQLSTKKDSIEQILIQELFVQ